MRREREDREEGRVHANAQLLLMYGEPQPTKASATSYAALPPLVS
jgi:hypothetical protein